MSRAWSTTLLFSTCLSTTLLLQAGPASAEDWLNANPVFVAQATQPSDGTGGDHTQTQPQTQQPQAQQPVVLQPLTVTGTKDPTPQDQVPATIDVIDQEKIQRKQPLTVGDMLDDLPGVEVEGGPKGSQSQPNIRGFGGTKGTSQDAMLTLVGRI